MLKRKPLELPAEIANAFVKDMHAFHRTKDQIKRAEIAARQRFALSQFQGPKPNAEKILKGFYCPLRPVESLVSIAGRKRRVRRACSLFF